MRRIRPLLVVSLAILPALAEAQYRRVPQRRSSYDRVSDRQMSLVVGALDTDFAGDDHFPMAALRADWGINRFLRLEVSGSYALGDIQRTNPPATGDPNTSTSLGAVTLGLLAEWPLRFGRPYVGVAAGLFGRFDAEDKDQGGQRFVRPTNAVPVGLRLPLSDRLSLRGEARFRFDQFKSGASATNVEETIGLSFNY
jgi:hypothetical protein